jgi:hypothetical protein
VTQTLSSSAVSLHAPRCTIADHAILGVLPWYTLQDCDMPHRRQGLYLLRRRGTHMCWSRYVLVNILYWLLS